MRRNLPQIFRHLRELAEYIPDSCNAVELLRCELRELEKQKWGPRKKKKHKAIEGQDGDGI